MKTEIIRDNAVSCAELMDWIPADVRERYEFRLDVTGRQPCIIFYAGTTMSHIDQLLGLTYRVNDHTFTVKNDAAEFCFFRQANAVNILIRDPHMGLLF